MTRTFTFLAAAATVGLVATACGSARGPERGASAPRKVAVVPAAVRKVPVVIEAGGVIEARATAVVASRIAAEVTAVHVGPGDRVQSGQRLVTLDRRDLLADRARVAASVESAERARGSLEAERDGAEAALSLAKATHERIAGLHARGSATAQELDEAASTLGAAEARWRAAEARLRELEASLESARAGFTAADVRTSFAVLTAPFGGIVTERLVEPGNLATPGTPLLRLEALDALRLQVRVDESRVGLLSVGSPADAIIPRRAPDAGRGDLHLAASIVEIARAVESSPHTFLVKIELPDHGGLRSGLFARARMPVGERDALVVPNAALRRHGQLPTLFVVSEGGVARMRVVSAGSLVDDHIEVLAGLAPGEPVVLSPPPDLHDGDPVRTLTGSAAPREVS